MTIRPATMLILGGALLALAPVAALAEKAPPKPVARADSARVPAPHRGPRTEAAPGATRKPGALRLVPASPHPFREQVRPEGRV